MAEAAGRRIGESLTAPGSINDLLVRYYQIAFAGERLAPSTKVIYRAMLDRFREEHGRRPVKGMSPYHMEVILARMADRPAAANNLRKRLIPVFKLAVKLKWLAVNPAELADPIQYHAKGHHTWTEAEIARFYEVHKPGTTAHTAMVLMLWTGAARVDVVKLGWFSIKPTPAGERLQYTRQKTGRMKSSVLISLPIAPELRAVLDRLPKEAGTFLQTRDGRQRSAKSLTGDMRAWCDVAGLPDCNNHGLRKAIARRMANAGANAFMIGAVTGHKTLSEVQRYTEAHDRDQLAERGIALLSGTEPEEKLASLPAKFAKKSRKDMK